MSHRIVAATIAAVACIAVAAPAASAEYLMPKSQAESFTQSDATTRYYDLGVADNNIAQSCRPSRDHKLNPYKGKRYHRWVCSWVSVALSGKECRGTMLIVGSGVDINNTYGQLTLEGARCKTVKQ